MESTSCLLTEWTLEAGGHFKADSVFLVKKGACVVLEDIALHLEKKFEHAPNSVEADSGNKSCTLFSELAYPSLWFECMWFFFGSASWRFER